MCPVGVRVHVEGVRASFPLAREVWELSPGLRLRDAGCQAHPVPSACTRLVLFLPISLIP